ncbi:hypothetical protein PENTCL1PPCAC_8714, partial [Pristionchus entomophagus]
LLAMEVVQLSEKKKLPEETWIYQVNDGTIFYFKLTAPPRLFVKLQDEEIDAELPCKHIIYVGAFGNAVYFDSIKKIFAAVFVPENGITVHFVRDKLEGESWQEGGLCTRLVDGAKFVYRMCDDPERDAILIEESDEELKEMKLRNIHREIAIYLSVNTQARAPTARKLKENIIIIEVPDNSLFNAYAPPQIISPFLYIAFGGNLFILDTDLIDLSHSLRIGDIYIYSIAGVHNRSITMMGIISKQFYLTTALLPDKFVCQSGNMVNVYGEALTIEELVQRYKEVSSDLARELTKNEGEKAKLHNTINVLLNKNAELTLEIDDIITAHEEEKDVLNTTIAELRINNAALTVERDRIQKMNEHENNELISELRKIIAELKQDIDPIPKLYDDIGPGIKLSPVTSLMSPIPSDPKSS